MEVQALVRQSSADKPEVKELTERGVKIVIADINGPVEKLVEIQKGVDVTVSAIDAHSLHAQKNLATAAKQAGVKRFVPCAWITVAPAGGVMVTRDHKEDVYNHIKRLHLPFTVIDVGTWHQVSFPGVLPSGRFAYAALVPMNLVHGDGERSTVIGDLRDIGRWTARILDDERTLNKYVLAWSDSLSDNEIFSIVEEVTGEKLQRQTLSYGELETLCKEARENYEREPTNVNFGMRQFRDYQYSKYVRGDNQVEYAKYLGYLDAQELFPDFHPITFRDFLGDLLDGKIEKPRYQLK
ncbi:putative pinoresinol-lariciresinol reductase 3 [Lasiodiplodia hormozganensis]|uniref:Pinoresinol-lariciresinol reductase 3 n=1 Tax=Lasiodiplodia hormozganensis TaxID=869390 RepID=A0AA39YKK0_9PEZI|nr:putative pinoresinol-lariciresinol reductase 3 [Lasiodiplodia hormozganensis]